MASIKSAVMHAVVQSAPSATRPRMSPSSEAKLADVETRSAACYADAESTTARLLELADSIDAECVPEATPKWDDESSVHHIEELRRRTTTGNPPLKKA